MKDWMGSKIIWLKNIKAEVVAVIVMSFILGSMLFFKPVIGMADNGDFYRIMQPMGIYHLSNDYNTKHFGYFTRQYGIDRYSLQYKENFLSTQTLPIKLAVLLNQIFRKDYIFDIRFLALIYSILFIISLYIIAKYNMPKLPVQRWLLIGVLLLIFADVGYIAYFNSFYGEPASYTFLLLTLAASFLLVVQEKPKIAHFMFFTLSALLLTGAKQQNSPLGVLFALLSLRYIVIRKDLKWRIAAVVSCVALLLTAGVVYSSISEEIKLINQYHTITLGILKDSPDPGKDLEELGIDRKFSLLAGTVYYDPYSVIPPDSPVMKKEFYSKYSFIKIIMFYMTNFDRFMKKMEIASQNAFSIRPVSLGNYEKAEGMLQGKKSNAFSVWSSFKERVMPHTLKFLVYFYIMFMSLCITLYIRSKKIQDKMRIEILALVVVIGVMQFIISLIGAGEADLSKHLFLFDVCFDIIFAATLVVVLGTILSFIPRFKASTEVDL